VFFGRDNTVTLPDKPQHLRIREVHAQQEINVILDMISREMDSDTPAHERATHHYLGLLGVWLERQAVRLAPGATPPDAARRLVARFTQLMEREFRRGAGVGELAAKLGVTPTHLTRCCRGVRRLISCRTAGSSRRCGFCRKPKRRLVGSEKAWASTRLPISPAPSRTSPACRRQHSAGHCDREACGKAFPSGCKLVASSADAQPERQALHQESIRNFRPDGRASMKAEIVSKNLTLLSVADSSSLCREQTFNRRILSLTDGRKTCRIPE